MGLLLHFCPDLTDDVFFQKMDGQTYGKTPGLPG